MRTELPIDRHLPGILEALASQGAVVLTAEPGAGKTTRLPPAVMDSCPGEVWVLEPRRLAARLAARRVAAERGQRTGDEVGYQVRFDSKVGRRTRLRYMTEGVLTRRLASDGAAALKGVAAVVLDELHERHVETDLAFSLLDHLRRKELPDLRLVVMSATLETGPIADLLGAPVIEVPGRLHPIHIEPLLRRDDRPLEVKVHTALGRLLDEGLDGHVLCFLPGVSEIGRAADAIGGLARRADLEVYPLHGRLGVEAMQQALRPSSRRKVILATNLAESSVTLDGVQAVIDSGLERVAGISPKTGLRTLELQPIPRDSATQRANRAGRQAAGRCLRLYTRVDHDRRPRARVPELLRSDLTGPLLTLRAAGVQDPQTLRWIDSPPGPGLAKADALLRRLGATDEQGGLTPVGRELLRYPLPPRLARVVVEGVERGVAAQAVAAAALLSERDIRHRSHRQELADERSDVLVLVDLLEEARGGSASRLRAMGVDRRAFEQVDRVRRQVQRLAGDPGETGTDEGRDEDLLKAVLAGHPDRVARRHPRKPEELTLAGGGSATLARESAVQSCEWLVVLDAADLRRGGNLARVRIASGIEPDWLLELFPEALEEEQQVCWDPKRERVESSWRLTYGALVLDESVGDADPGEQTRVLQKAALDAGPEAFADADALQGLMRRLTFARAHRPELPDLDPHQVLVELCEGRRSFGDLRQADLLGTLRGRLTWEENQLLDRLAPTHVVLTGGRRCLVTYETRQPPWIKSRLQDFFGMTAGPTVAGGQVPLVLHLQAPNRQAVSVTSDLAGFWERHYPATRRELKRRYPKHAWPEDPRTARAPRPGRTR